MNEKHSQQPFQAAPFGCGKYRFLNAPPFSVVWKNACKKAARLCTGRLFCLCRAQNIQNLRPLFKNGHGRKDLAFQKFEEGAAAGGNVRKLIGHLVLFNGSDRITAPGN